MFDLGGVLMTSGAGVGELAVAAGVDEAVFAPAYWAPRHAYDLGSSGQDYWTAVLGGTPDPALVRRLVEIESAAWTVLPPASAALLERLRGERLAVLSNAPRPLAAAARGAGWSSAMAALAFSSETGLMKPDPAVYARADELLGPGPMVFFDDKPENVDAARAHGWEAHLWAGHDAALATLGR